MAKRNEGEVLIAPLLWTYSKNQDGLHPVKLRITFQRKREYYSVLNERKEKVFLAPDLYQKTVACELRLLKGKNRELRQAIDTSVEAAKQAVIYATNNGKEPFSFAEFERKFLGEESGRQFLHFFDRCLTEMEKKGQAGTVRTYTSVRNSFSRFLGKDIDPAEISPQLLQRYEDSMRDAETSDTWIAICMRTIRGIYNRLSVHDEYLKMKYPFSRSEHDCNYKIPVSTGQKGVTMTKDEMIQFVSAQVPGKQSAANPYYKAKCLFLFSFYAQGLNFKDIALLRNRNISNDIIEVQRQKTIRTKRKPSTIRIPITTQLKAIIQEIGTESKKPEAYIFNAFDSQVTYTQKQIDARVLQFTKTTNKWLKRYCEKNGLLIVTTYAARHTFASIAKGQMPVHQISAMLGHSKIETTQIYLGRFEDEQNRRGLEKVFELVEVNSPNRKTA